MKTIVFTVTNDLNYDQRMQRICSSLANAGYEILLVGRNMPSSIALKEQVFKQKRLNCFFSKAALFYAEYNLRLFFFLLFIKMDAVCAIDLDTILPCYLVSVFRKKKRAYDAHELFTEMKEVVTRPLIKKQWMKIEKFTVPKFKFGYTVSYSIAEEFNKRYAITYDVIRNMPVKKASLETSKNAASTEKFILYQGAVNEARGLENLIVAMKKVDSVLHIYGDGNLYDEVKNAIKKNQLEHKIFLKGKLVPAELYAITQQAYIGINLVEPIGLNQIYSLANKFFDYIQAGVPQVTMNFPEYNKVNDEYEVAVLVNTVDANEIADALNYLLHNVDVHERLHLNCMPAKEIYNWQQEEIKLLEFYKRLFSE